MKLDAVGVPSSNLQRSIEFYSLLGFTFHAYTDQSHIEAVSKTGEVRLMLDAVSVVVDILGHAPVPANYSVFALRYDSPHEVDEITRLAFAAGFTLVKEPWNAVWGQRYAIMKDPDGTLIDLFATL
ncbi:MAG: VOC family protein [Patescibacteria group bacterium]